MNQQKLKLQPVKKLTRNLKDKKMSFQKIHEIYKGDKRHDKNGGDDVSSIEEAQLSSSKYYVNENNDDLVSVFDASTCSGDIVHDVFDMRGEILLSI